MNKIAILTLAALPLAACNTNSAIGNDREAQLDPPATAAPIECCERSSTSSRASCCPRP